MSSGFTQRKIERQVLLFMQQDDKEIILEKLESHDKRITKNTDDINDIKVNAAIQETTVKTLNKSMERLTDTINK